MMMEHVDFSELRQMLGGSVEQLDRVAPGTLLLRDALSPEQTGRGERVRKDNRGFTGVTEVQRLCQGT